jgi:hypothetical protein
LHTRSGYRSTKDIRPFIRAAVEHAGGDPERLHFLNWGKHRASNDFRKIKHTVIIGANLYHPARYEAMTRAALDRPIDVSVSKHEIQRTREGEVKQNFLQAAGRSAIRIANGDDCPVGCTLWVIYSTHGGEKLSRDLLRQTFPNAIVENWEPIPRPSLRGGPKLKTNNRPKFVNTLKERAQRRDELLFTAYDFPGEFSDRMVKRLCRDEAVRTALAEAGLKLSEPEREKRGRARINVWRLRRDDGQDAI